MKQIPTTNLYSLNIFSGIKSVKAIIKIIKLEIQIKTKKTKAIFFIFVTCR